MCDPDNYDIPGRFKGAELDLLTKYIATYTQIEKGSRGYNQRLEEFWHALRFEF